MRTKQPAGGPPPTSGQPAPQREESATPGSGHLYRIRVEGQLDAHWSAWLGGLKVVHDSGGNTILVGPVRDQAALFGLLTRIRDLGLPLISLTRLDMDGGERVDMP